MREKESSFRVKVDLQALQERNNILKDQLQVYRTRIIELEKENIVQSKENYLLNSELDYEGHRAAQLQRQNDKFVSGVTVNKVTNVRAREDLVAEYETRIEELESDLRYYKSKADDTVKKNVDRSEINRLTKENDELKLEVDRLQRKIDEESRNFRARQ